MEFLSSTILTGILYDGFKTGAKLSVTFLKEKLQGWLFDEAMLEQLVINLQDLKLDELADHVIERKINESSEILECMQQIKTSQNIKSVVQNHTGSGDNIARDKVVNN